MQILQKQFENAYDQKSWTQQYENYQQIADDFAVSFAVWVDRNFFQGEKINQWSKSTRDFNDGVYFSLEQLMVEFKRELSSNGI
jgi:hypothetical protein